MATNGRSPRKRRSANPLARALSALRACLFALGVAGLLPGSHELLENLVHLLHDGHLAHSEAHDIEASVERCSADTEHDCTPLDHHCACCVSLAALPEPPRAVLLPEPGATSSLGRPFGQPPPPQRALDPPYHPPIEA